MLAAGKSSSLWRRSRQGAARSLGSLPSSYDSDMNAQTSADELQELVLSQLNARRGHFLLESGHHGSLWLDLETLCLRPSLLAPAVDRLAAMLRELGVQAVCGPLVEGAFVALMVAEWLGVSFAYAERFSRPVAHGLFPAGYRVPTSLRAALDGTRVAIVNDVINAGSAVRGAFEDLQTCGASVVAMGSLLVLGNSAAAYAASKNVALHAVAAVPNELWTAAACPLCAAGVPLQDVAGFRSA